MIQALLLPTVLFSLVSAPCPDYPLDNGGWSCYHPDTMTVYMPRFDRWTFLHELGHAYDFQTLTDADRAEIQPMLQQSNGPWEGGTFTGPDEEFASDYADCVMGYELANRRVCWWLFLHPASVEAVSIR